MSSKVETRPAKNSIGGFTLLHSAAREIAGIRTSYIMLEVEYSDPKDAEWLYAVAVGESDYRLRLFRCSGDAEQAFRTALENEIVSYVFDDMLTDLGLDTEELF